MGVPYVEDTNDPNQPVAAITKLRTTVTADGKRSSTFEAFLPARFAETHKNLSICIGAIVQRLDLVQEGESFQVQGVFVEDESSAGETYYVQGKEIILCGGAVSSAQLLLLRYSDAHRG
jgi:choline dehydrogenase